MARTISASSGPLLVLAGLVLAGLLFTGTAAADDGPSQIDRDAARTLVQQGDERVEEGDFEGALEAYRRADDIMGVPTTAIEVARMHEKLGQLVAAYSAYKRAAKFAQKDGEPEPFTTARADAKKRIAELKPRIPKLELAITGIAGDVDVEVTIDEEVVEAWGRPFRIDPGAHAIAVRAEGYEEHADTFVIDEGSRRTIDIAMVAEDEPPVGDRGQSATLDMWPLAIAGFSAAGLGVVVGAVTGGLHLSDASTLKDQCPNGVCPPSQQGTFDRSRTMAHLSTASFAFAGVGAALGTIGLILSLNGDEEDATTSSTTVTIQLGATQVGIHGRF